MFGLGFLGTKLSQAWRSRLLRLGGALVTGMGAWMIYQAVNLFQLQ